MSPRRTAVAALAWATLLVLLVGPAAGQSGGPAPAIAFDVSPLFPEVGEAVTFTDRSDPDFGNATRTWSFGDGGRAFGLQVQHAYVEPGTYRVALFVGDEAAFLNITVVAKPEPPQQVPQEGNGTGLAAAFDVDPVAPAAGFPVRFVDRSAGPSTVVRWQWDFGDGQGAAGELRPEHTYQEAGTYTVTLSVEDADGQTAATSLELTVSELAPGEKPPLPVNQAYPGDPGYGAPAPAGLLVAVALLGLAALVRRRV